MMITFTRNPFLKSFKPSATLVLLSLFVNANLTSAQNNSKDPAQGVPPPKQASQEEQKASDIEIRQKIYELENSGGDPIEIQKQKLSLLKSAGIKVDLSLTELDYSFQPKYIPMAQYENWKSIATAYSPSVTKYIVFINQGYFLDYNNYTDRAINKKIADLGFLNPIDENAALKYILPDLTLFANNLPQGASLVSNLKLYFAAHPDLYVMLPQDVIAKTKSDSGIKSLAKSQESAKKN
jgi:hypothetical protein